MRLGPPQDRARRQARGAGERGLRERSRGRGLGETPFDQLVGEFRARRLAQSAQLAEALDAEGAGLHVRPGRRQAGDQRQRSALARVQLQKASRDALQQRARTIGARPAGDRLGHEGVEPLDRDQSRPAERHQPQQPAHDLRRRRRGARKAEIGEPPQRTRLAAQPRGRQRADLRVARFHQRQGPHDVAAALGPRGLGGGEHGEHQIERPRLGRLRRRPPRGGVGADRLQRRQQDRAALRAPTRHRPRQRIDKAQRRRAPEIDDPEQVEADEPAAAPPHAPPQRAQQMGLAGAGSSRQHLAHGVGIASAGAHEEFGEDAVGDIAVEIVDMVRRLRPEIGGERKIRSGERGRGGRHRRPRTGGPGKKNVVHVGIRLPPPFSFRDIADHFQRLIARIRQNVAPPSVPTPASPD